MYKKMYKTYKLVHTLFGLFNYFILSQIIFPHSLSLQAAPSTAVERVKKAGQLNICLDPDNLPYSHSKKTPQGFDVEISELLAKELGVKANYVWVDTVRDTPLGELIEEKCDCAVGTAIESNTADEMENVGEKVIFTLPYYSTGYILITKADAPQPKKLEEVKGKKIGAEAGSVADYNLNLKGFDRRLYPRQESILQGVETGEVAAGFMWAPNVGWMFKTEPNARLKIVENYVPETDFRWNVGVAVRKEEKDLKEAIDKVIEKILKNQQAEKILKNYGVPYFPPFK